MPMIDFEPLVSTYGLLEVLKWDRMGDFQPQPELSKTHTKSVFLDS
jgi:hypothetical protein